MQDIALDGCGSSNCDKNWIVQNCSCKGFSYKNVPTVTVHTVIQNVIFGIYL